ncbi:hypothetical protein RZN05_18180 [Sphingomonas sp. HF-S4]|uniref:Ferritin-like domain-containing protein n=1 Tax=Sphingomonas agrestis TaxID=3080540 RepID=A0ABU3YC05_9SPHN|nr:hypothetical protein [Sphingomonas sp. HF-S4]MDV3458931.1 hypothetical protein [Sphingomonas sp. HF-S4]
MIVEEMIADKTIPSTTILEQVRNLAQPLASGHYVEDWDTRSFEIGRLSDAYSLLAKENGHWANTTEVAAVRPLSVTASRYLDNESTTGQARLSMNFDFTLLDGEDYRVVSKAAARLDSAEKIVISSAAYALCYLDNPPELTLELMNLLYEEALHLEAIGRLLGIDHSEREWIPEDRLGNWELVRGCTSPLEYMVIEHCLYEGRGTIASAEGAYQLERAGVSSPVVAVMDAIARQEANHNISGFRWLRLLDRGRAEDDAALASTVRRFVEVEPVPDADGSDASLRKHFPFFLIQVYRDTGDFRLLKEHIVAASRNARRAGGPGIAPEELYRQSEKALAWCSVTA